MATEPGAQQSASPRVITAFVASPEELRPERELMENVIRDLNRGWIATSNLYLDLVKWESAPFGPGVDVDSDAGREKPSANDYDLFIGLLWSHFHVPPPSWIGAGTVKEFARAYESFYFKHTCEALFYFKEAEGSRSHNPEEQARVDAFRANLGNPSIRRRLFASVRGQSPGAARRFHYGFERRDELASLFRDGLSRTVDAIATGRTYDPEEVKRAAAERRRELWRRRARLLLDRLLSSLWLVITIVIVVTLTGIAALVLDDIVPGQEGVGQIVQIVGYIITLGLLGLLIWRLGGWGSKSKPGDDSDEDEPA